MIGNVVLVRMLVFAVDGLVMLCRTERPVRGGYSATGTRNDLHGPRRRRVEKVARSQIDCAQEASIGLTRIPEDSHGGGLYRRT